METDTDVRDRRSLGKTLDKVIGCVWSGRDVFARGSLANSDFKREHYARPR